MKVRLVILAIALVTVLSGCVRMHLTLDIAEDDTAQSTIIVALNDGVARTLGYDDPADAWADFEAEALEGAPSNVTTVPYAKGGFTGVTVTVPSTPIDSLKLGGANIRVVRDGDTYVVTGGLSEEDLEMYQSQETDDLDIVYTISFPGEVLEHNGNLVDSNTVQWSLAGAHAFDMRAVGSALSADPSLIDGATDARVPAALGAGGLIWIWIGALAVAVLLAAVVIVVSRRKRSAK